ncbi:heme-thiolate peroxidase [Crepidotus variabilis]|uniref:Heme-thiolate peroxidase n=1 Tax=Crepidotus variabilis TaxID=179855 RepID=A0A9P6EFZ3_9AGAR|nr:heme-thiolate peroxidase [Crepidotus variabilis]
MATQLFARNVTGFREPQSADAKEPHSDKFRHAFPPATANRSPCPALNTLANHGFISRTGRNLRFGEVIQAINHVYNLSHPFCVLLAFGGFITCGRLRLVAPRFNPSPIHGHQVYNRPSEQSVWSKLGDRILGAIGFLIGLSPVSWTLDLDRLSQRGFFKIAHNASLVHPNNAPSTSPDPKLLADFLAYKPRVEDLSISKPTSFKLIDIAKYHELRMDASHSKPEGIHGRIASGECALMFLVLRGKGRSRFGDKTTDGAVTVSHLEQWFGQERLPDGWWDLGEDGLRPQKTIKISDARELAVKIEQLGKAHISHP